MHIHAVPLQPISLSLFRIPIFYLLLSTCPGPPRSPKTGRDRFGALSCSDTKCRDDDESEFPQSALSARLSLSFFFFFLLLLAAVSNNARVSIRDRTPSLSFFLVVTFTYLSSFSHSLSPFRPEDSALLETFLTVDRFHVWECVRTTLPLEVGVWVPLSRVGVQHVQIMATAWAEKGGGGKPAAYLWGRTLTTGDNAVAAGIDRTGESRESCLFPLLCSCSAAVKLSEFVAYRQKGLSSLVYSLSEQPSESELPVEVGCRRHSINARKLL